MPPHPPSTAADACASPDAPASGARDTRDRILDAAESLFASDGVDGTSLRRITRTADVNLAAIHYHFGSKEDLVDAVVARIARPLCEAQEAALEAAGDAAVRDVLRAFLEPVMASQPTAEQGARLGALLSRLQAQPADQVESLFQRHFGATSARFVAALQAALPDHPREVVADRFRFAMGVVTHVFSGAFALDTISGHPCELAAPEREPELASSLLSFLVAGLEAPHPGPDRLRALTPPSDAQESDR